MYRGNILSTIGTFQIRILDWVAISFSRGSSQPRDQTLDSYVSWICCFSVVQSCLTLCNLMNCSTPGFPVLHYLLEFAQIHVDWVSDAIQPSHPLLSPLLLPSLFPSIRVFSNELALYIRWPKYWSFCFSISPSNEYSGLISSRINWSYVLAIQGTLKSLLQHHSSKAWIDALALSLHCGPILTSIHDYWKNYSFEYTDLRHQSNVSDF